MPSVQHPDFPNDADQVLDRALMYASIRNRLLRRTRGELTRTSEGAEFDIEDIVKAAQACGDYGSSHDDVVS